MANVESVGEKYEVLTSRDHVLRKDMWAGSSKEVETSEYVVLPTKTPAKPYEMKFVDVAYPPALYKCVDEAVVNALDHYIEQSTMKEKVTWIKLDFNMESGRISIANNGPGIEIEIHPKAQVYIAQMIFGQMYAGRNMSKSADSITGGTNGVGIKIANILSSEFTIETVRKNKTPNYHKYYFQRWTKNMEIVDAPLIVDLKKANTLSPDKVIEHTKITFVPDYIGVFGYKLVNGKLPKKLMETICNMIRTRAFLAAAYTPCEIYFNNERIPISTLDDIANLMFGNVEKFACTLGKPKRGQAATAECPYPWDICIALVENTATSKKNFCQLSIVNGVVVKDGKHTEYLMDEIIKGVKEGITKFLNNSKINFKPDLVYSNIFLFANTKIPGVSWTSQTKDHLEITTKGKFTGYKFDPKYIAQLTAKLQEQILGALYQEVKKPKNKSVVYEKYFKANFAGKKGKSHLCSLLLPEGDSAKGMASNGMTYREPTAKGKKVIGEPLLGFDYYGILTLGGVIMNIRKAMKVVKTVRGDRYSPSNQLSTNIFWTTFLDVTGLNINYRYDKLSPTYEKEKDELRYGCIIGFVDQDHDGVGLIFSLILNIFDLLWPNLIVEGYVKRFATPLRRAFPKSGGKVLEFFSDAQYENWLKEDAANESKYTIKYIKGLSTHTEDEVIHMFKNFKNNLYTYTLEDVAVTAERFNVYFGDDADKRKLELSTPLQEAPFELLEQQQLLMKIDCNDHLQYEAKSHDCSNLYQKLWSAVDGMNESGRKILDGSEKKFAVSKSEIKVAQLAGFISEHENYHHGQASLESSITGKAFLSVGGVQMPQLVPYGNFGSRAHGGADAGQPRYIETKLNSKLTYLLFPLADKPLLTYTFDEGNRGEPKYYVPIIPTAVLESIEMPAHGWKIKVWARDFFDVLKNVRRLISTTDDAELHTMANYSLGFKGVFKTIRGSPYCFGTYIYDQVTNTVTITELPLRVWHQTYFDKMIKYKKDSKVPKKAFIDAANSYNHSSDNEIRIVFKLFPGTAEKITEMADEQYADGFEEYFQLRNHMDSHLNMIGKDMSVIEFSNYKDIITHWFLVRKELYGKRVDREIVLLQLRIRFLENIIRYISEYEKLAIKGKKKVVAIEIMAANNFDKFAKNKVDNPKFIPTDKLVEVITTGEKANYDYLLYTNDMQRLDEEIVSRNTKLEELKKQLQDLITKALIGRFRGAQIWLEELDALEQVVKTGQESKWKFGEKSKFKY